MICNGNFKIFCISVAKLKNFVVLILHVLESPVLFYVDFLHEFI
jgi:hypothetical protein